MVFSCSKDNSTNNKPQDPTIPVSEFETLKRDFEELKAKVEALTPSSSGNSEEVVSIAEFEALKQENETLKAKVESLTSVFFEVDGLRFDKNGEIISTPRIESTTEKQTNNGTLTMTRTYDNKGRLIETYGKYSGYNSAMTPPYYWQRINYEYDGKTCKMTYQTHSYSYGVYTHEETMETTYW